MNQLCCNKPKSIVVTNAYLFIVFGFSVITDPSIESFDDDTWMDIQYSGGASSAGDKQYKFECVLVTELLSMHPCDCSKLFQNQKW